jgi:hypothetical protein
MQHTLQLLVAALIGALATGGVRLVLDLLNVQRRRRVAARILMGDLYLLEQLIPHVLRIGRWPDWDPDVKAALGRWEEVRNDLATGPSAEQWGKVDRVYGQLARTEQRITTSTALIQDDRDVLDDLLEKIPDANLVLAKEGTTRRERCRHWLKMKWREMRS